MEKERKYLIRDISFIGKDRLDVLFLPVYFNKEGGAHLFEESVKVFKVLGLDKRFLSSLKMKRGDIEYIFTIDNIGKIFLLSFGDEKHIKPWHLLSLFSPIASFLKRYKGKVRVGVVVDSLKCDKNSFMREQVLQNLVYGLEVALFDMKDFKSDGADKKKDKDEFGIEEVFIYVDGVNGESEKVLGDAIIFSKWLNFCRYLGNLPSNVLYPESFVVRAMEHLDRFGVEYEVWNKRKIEELGLSGVLAVSSGSSREPRFLKIKYDGGGDKKIALVGKGVCFDSGGINLKTSDYIYDMKYDMSGAGAVLSLMLYLIEVGFKAKLEAYIPLVENMPSGSAIKPGDVIKMANGKYVEIGNTDAEGRLILADALHLASLEKPDIILDFATLTGAIIIALGYEAIGVMGNDEERVRLLLEAGEFIGERAWELPLWDEYREYLKSDIADINNIGGRAGGSITAGIFLKEFVSDTAWIHLDIAGTAWYEKGKKPFGKMATGAGMRITKEFLKRFIEK